MNPISIPDPIEAGKEAVKAVEALAKNSTPTSFNQSMYFLQFIVFSVGCVYAVFIALPERDDFFRKINELQLTTFERMTKEQAEAHAKLQNETNETHEKIIRLIRPEGLGLMDRVIPQAERLMAPWRDQWQKFEAAYHGYKRAQQNQSGLPQHQGGSIAASRQRDEHREQEGAEDLGEQHAECPFNE